jgi:plastocyanin
MTADVTPGSCVRFTVLSNSTETHSIIDTMGTFTPSGSLTAGQSFIVDFPSTGTFTFTDGITSSAGYYAVIFVRV